MKKNTTYKLAESTVSIVKDLADKEGCSQSNVIDKAILMYCSIYYGIVDMRDNPKPSLNDTNNTMVKQDVSTELDDHDHTRHMEEDKATLQYDTTTRDLHARQENSTFVDGVLNNSWSALKLRAKNGGE